MRLISRYGKNIKGIRWYDISLLKITVMFYTLFLVTAWAGFRNLVFVFEWYWYLIIAVILTIPQLNKWFSN